MKLVKTHPQIEAVVKVWTISLLYIFFQSSIYVSNIEIKYQKSFQQARSKTNSVFSRVALTKYIFAVCVNTRYVVRLCWRSSKHRLTYESAATPRDEWNARLVVACCQVMRAAPVYHIPDILQMFSRTWKDSSVENSIRIHSSQISRFSK